MQLSIDNTHNQGAFKQDMEDLEIFPQFLNYWLQSLFIDQFVAFPLSKGGNSEVRWTAFYPLARL